MKLSTEDPSVDRVRRGFAVVVALLVAGMFLKAFFLAMLIVIAYALKFVGIALSAMWLTTITAGAIALMAINWKQLFEFYSGVWKSCRGTADNIFSKKETV